MWIRQLQDGASGALMGCSQLRTTTVTLRRRTSRQMEEEGGRGESSPESGAASQTKNMFKPKTLLRGYLSHVREHSCRYLTGVLHHGLGRQAASRQAASRLGSHHRVARCVLARIITVWFVLGFLG